jgi:alanine dehydrogenase
VYQDTDHPLNFVTEDEKSILKPGTLIIDVSCDEGMGFYFAKPTSFKVPILHIGEIDYYAVDHTPSYLWESASRSISAALIVHLASVLDGREGWMENSTIKKAINIDKGVVVKESVLVFQNRLPDYPHHFIKSEKIESNSLKQDSKSKITSKLLS